jgi:hypothetical protein
MSGVRLVLMYEDTGFGKRLVHFVLLPESHFAGDHTYKFMEHPYITAICGAEFPYKSWDTVRAEYLVSKVWCLECTGL